MVAEGGRPPEELQRGHQDREEARLQQEAIPTHEGHPVRPKGA